MKTNNFLVLILCGGRSLRLWPVSEYKSKNFLDVFGFSPLEITIRRFLKLTPSKNIFLIANKKEKKFLQKIKLVNKENIFFEPESKNTAAAVLLALWHLSQHKSKPLLIAPVDHFIQKEKEFYKAVYKSIKVAQEGAICTFGIVPREPSADFGYIQIGQKKDTNGAYLVKRFIEKPSVSKAKVLIRKGDCFYNSGIFCSSVSTLLNEYKKYYPHYDDFCRYWDKNLPYLYRKIKDIPFDKAIMENSCKVKMVKSNFSWRDFGSWLAIYEALPKDKDGNAIKGNAFIYKGKNNLIYLDNSKKRILFMGLKDICFIDTKEYALLTDKSVLANLKAVLKEFNKTK
ncbi:MAG: mannose-1-phosphate guanylyltransferase [Candidatus Omnitrophica bacterium]|jgi:mannose-1-phosphate guanylyltransferase/mannose-6-phosphate isomerase|nr:mannose-1-phosphate guanylyltransferase [Candidatus Omnitrophota bacterium]